MWSRGSIIPLFLGSTQIKCLSVDMIHGVPARHEGLMLSIWDQEIKVNHYQRLSSYFWEVREAGIVPLGACRAVVWTGDPEQCSGFWLWTDGFSSLPKLLNQLLGAIFLVAAKEAHLSETGMWQRHLLIFGNWELISSSHLSARDSTFPGREVKLWISSSYSVSE